MKSKSQIFGAAVLMIVFGLSNIGLPIVMYFCPMMQDSPSGCSMACEAPSDNLALINQNPACCSSYVVAERNTTPFVKTEKSNSDIVFVVFPMSEESLSSNSTTTFIHQSEFSPLASPPIFLLNSAFLI